MIELPWIAEARKYIGLKEFPGSANNPVILRWFDAIRSGWFKEDSVPWCAAFVGGCLEAVGIKSTRSAAALSYSAYGVKVLTPVYGCIATKLRFNAAGKQVGGHVGFIVGRTPKGDLLCLGGNQGDAVSIATYPRTAFRDYRMPPGLWEQQELPVTGIPGTAAGKES